MEKIKLQQPKKAKLPTLPELKDNKGVITLDFEKRCREYKDAGDCLVPTAMVTERKIPKDRLHQKEGNMAVTTHEVESEKYELYETVILN